MWSCFQKYQQELRVFGLISSWSQDGCHTTRHHILRPQHPKQEKREGYKWALLLNREENMSQKIPRKFPITSQWIKLQEPWLACTSQFIPMTGCFANSIHLTGKKGKLMLEWVSNSIYPNSTTIWSSRNVTVVIFQPVFLNDDYGDDDDDNVFLTLDQALF